MGQHALIYPMFAMVLLTCIVLFALFRSRVRAVADGEVSASYFKTYSGAQEPEASAKLSRHFANIFEAPTLFYAACLAAMVTAQSSLTVQALAWTYVALRAVHAFVHTGGNKLRPRIMVYFASWVVLLTMWTVLAIGVLNSD